MTLLYEVPKSHHLKIYQMKAAWEACDNITSGLLHYVILFYDHIIQAKLSMTEKYYIIELVQALLLIFCLLLL